MKPWKQGIIFVLQEWHLKEESALAARALPGFQSAKIKMASLDRKFGHTRTRDNFVRKNNGTSFVDRKEMK